MLDKRNSASRTRGRVDEDGVRVEERRGVRPAVWLLALALVLGGAVLVLVRSPTGGDPRQEGRKTERQQPPAPAHAIAPRTSGQPAKRLRAVRRDERAGTHRLPEHQPAASSRDGAPHGKEDPTAVDEGDRPSGIALFPPPGTDPPKSGIVVPEGFELPAGYVRHYQATDDGKLLPPILMFHPDYEWVDERGNPVALPADRVVPAEMAPPGLAVEMLEVPDTQVPMLEPPPQDDGGGAAP